MASVQRTMPLMVLVVLGLLGHQLPAVEANHIPAKGGRCVEGSTWKDDCNTCTCSNGVGICTLIACPTQQEDRCTEGHTKPSDDGCNTCRCVNGVYACTKKICPDQAPRCTEGHSKPSDDGCNTCKCVNGVYACTRRACPIQAPRCTEGHSKPSDDGCNTCKCVNGVYACTRRACPIQEGWCIDGDIKDDGCNTCTCVNGRFICTKKYCPPTTSQAPQAWRDDHKCGPDHLAPNGQPAQCDPNGKYPCCSEYGWCGNTGAHCECTDCVDHRVSVPTCTDGHVKPAEDGCNTCTCSGGSYACTEICCGPHCTLDQDYVPKKG